MEFKYCEIDGLIEIQPKVFKDERGYFFESYSSAVFGQHGLDINFVQDNQSSSSKGVLRGLHLQKEPFAQGKLVRVITGKALDVVVDIRKNSKTLGKTYSVLLDAEKQNMFYVPPGFAHGFVCLEDAIFVYKCTNGYNKLSESGIRWNDPTLKIDWKIKNPLVNSKDQELPTFEDLIKSL